MDSVPLLSRAREAVLQTLSTDSSAPSQNDPFIRQFDDEYEVPHLPPTPPARSIELPYSRPFSLPTASSPIHSEGYFTDGLRSPSAAEGKSYFDQLRDALNRLRDARATFDAAVHEKGHYRTLTAEEGRQFYETFSEGSSDEDSDSTSARSPLLSGVRVSPARWPQTNTDDDDGDDEERIEPQWRMPTPPETQLHAVSPPRAERKKNEEEGFRSTGGKEPRVQCFLPSRPHGGYGWFDARYCKDHMQERVPANARTVPLAAHRAMARRAESLFHTLTSSQRFARKASTTREQMRRDKWLHAVEQRKERARNRTSEATVGSLPYAPRDEERTRPNASTASPTPLDVALACVGDPWSSGTAKDDQPPPRLGNGVPRRSVAAYGELPRKTDATKPAEQLLEEACAAVGVKNASALLPRLERLTEVALMLPTLDLFAANVCQLVEDRRPPSEHVGPAGLSMEETLVRLTASMQELESLRKERNSNTTLQ